MMSAIKIRNLVKPALVEWERLAKKVKAEEGACAERIAKDRARMAELELSIQTTIARGISPDGKKIAVQSLETEGAIVEVKDDGYRSIDPAEFFKAVPPKDRTEQFWDCFKVLIGKSEKFLPKALMETLADFESKLSTKVRLKK